MESKGKRSKFKEFQAEVAALGGIWAGEHVYFSQMLRGYTAAYKPCYPDNSDKDQSIYSNGESVELQKWIDGTRKSIHFKEVAEINLIHIQDIEEMLDAGHFHYETDEHGITFYYKGYSTDRARIEIGDDKKSIAVGGRIIGGMDEFKDWLYR